MVRILILLAVLAGLAFSTFGCNTAHGFGKDMERGGEKIQDAADQNR